MKYATLIAAAVLVLIANAFALLHAARNRSGAADAEITLTDREFHYYRDPDDSGVTLRLNWIGPVVYIEETTPWLDKTKLTELGFDCSVSPEDKSAYLFYSRQSRRAAFVALEYDGLAWRSRMEREREKKTPDSAYALNNNSRLVVIDAASNAATLRARYPQRDRVIVVPAVIGISVMGQTAPGKQAYLSGHIREIPAEIHVPRPFSDKFREPGRKLFRANKADESLDLYRVRLRYGSLLEPWVVGVEFPN